MRKTVFGMKCFGCKCKKDGDPGRSRTEGGYQGRGRTEERYLRRSRRKLAAVLCPVMVLAGIMVPSFSLHADDLVAGYLMASSTLVEPGYDYSVWLVQDYNTATTWTEGAEGDGYGESLYLETDPYTVITGGTICPGFYASEDLFYKNGAPTRIYIHTGQQEAYLDVTDYANTYEYGFEGYHFRFDEPLVSDGLVTMTIVGVRSGYKYQDTCISELRLEGYSATEETAPVISRDEPHVSLVLPYDDSTDGYWGNPFTNPDGLGGDGREPGEKDDDGSTDPDYLDGEIIERLRGFAQTLYLLHSKNSFPEEAEIHAEDLYSYSHACVLNWYQSKVRDDRILYAGQYNYAYEYDLEEIIDELFDTETSEQDVQALCDYFGAVREGEMIRMNAAGNNWEDKSFYLREPADAGEMMGKTLLIGSVMKYDPATRGFIQDYLYHAYFEQDPDDPEVFRFSDLYVG